MKAYGDDYLYLGDGDWLHWSDFGEPEEACQSHLARLEYQADLRHRFPKADIDLVPHLQGLLGMAEAYFAETGRHLQVYGDMGELFGAIAFGIKLHRNYAQGSDGRMGDDFVEIKTLTPFNKHDRTCLRMDRHFSKVLLVKVSADFRLSGRMFDRKDLSRRKGGRLWLNWNDVSGDEAHIELADLAVEDAC